MYKELKQVADKANTPAEVSDAINQISLAFVEGQISEEENHNLVFNMYARFYGYKGK